MPISCYEAADVAGVPMMPSAARSASRRLGGDPKEIARGLAKFGRSARVLSSAQPRLIERFPSKWVAVHSGRVAMSDANLKRLIARLKKAGIGPGETIIRFVDRKQKSLIL